MSDIYVKLKPVLHTPYRTPFGTSLISTMKTSGVIRFTYSSGSFHPWWEEFHGRWKWMNKGNNKNRNDPDLVQAFLKKWWVESDFKAPTPTPPLSLRIKDSGCHYNSIYSNTWTKQVKQLSNQRQTQSMSRTLLRHTLINKNIFDIFVETLSLYIFTIWKSIVYNLFCRDGI